MVSSPKAENWSIGGGGISIRLLDWGIWLDHRGISGSFRILWTCPVGIPLCRYIFLRVIQQSLLPTPVWPKIHAVLEVYRRRTSVLSVALVDGSVTCLVQIVESLIREPSALNTD